MGLIPIEAFVEFVEYFVVRIVLVERINLPDNPAPACPNCAAKAGELIAPLEIVKLSARLGTSC